MTPDDQWIGRSTLIFNAVSIPPSLFLLQSPFHQSSKACQYSSGSRPMPLPAPAVLSAAFPTASAIAASPSLLISTQALLALSSSSDMLSSLDESSKKGMMNVSPRIRSVFSMAVAMALHFGGYEFFRNSCVALFTSSDLGFSSPAAFPLANGLIGPFSLLLLWGYGRQLRSSGPRKALYRSTSMSIAFIGFVSSSLFACKHYALPKSLSQALIGITFLFQNSYQYLLYTQHWSFAGSVLTPEEGRRWIATITGCSSIFCSLMASLNPILLPRVGLFGLMASTMITLVATLLFSDNAYQIAENYGFDPTEKITSSKTGKSTVNINLSGAYKLFNRERTLMALFSETICFQTFSTILGVAFVTALKQQIPCDVDRSAYSSRLFSIINGCSAILQFLVIPQLLRWSEPAWIWRLMPFFPLVACGGLWLVLHTGTTSGSTDMALLAAAFGMDKVFDYSVRSVVYIMAYQPLDFASRFVGKEIIGLLGSRVGKSGMSLVLSGLTMIGWSNLPQLVQYALASNVAWLCNTWWLARLLPSKRKAQELVEERQQGKTKDR